MSKVHQSVIVKATTKNTLCTYESITPSLYRFHFIFIMTNVQDSKSYESTIQLTKTSKRGTDEHKGQF